MRNAARLWITVGVITCGLCAQESGARATLSGVLLDPSEAGVGGAKVTLKRNNAEVGAAVANASGGFQFERVAPGSYAIVVEHEGFKPWSGRVRVSARAPAPLVIRLELAEVQSEITVSGQPAQVTTNAADNQDSVTLDRQALDDLPIFDQDYIAMMSRFLDAGSIATGGTTILVDGVEASRAGVSPSAIQEVKINNDPYSAEYPRPGRSRIEIITKPGSSVYHGTFNFLFRDSEVNGRDPFSRTRPEEQRRIFEGSLTGPLGRAKRTSFLISANRQEEDQQSIVFAEGVTGTIQQAVAAPARNTEISGSINRQIGDEHLLSIRGLYTERSIRNQGVGGFVLAEAGTNFEDREDIVYFNHRGPLSGRFYNLFRLLVARQYTPTNSVNPGPKVVVLGAFTGGGAQGTRLQTENHIALNEIVVWTGEKQTLRFGINVPDISRRGLDDNTNTAGTYTYSSLADYVARRPISLVRQSGNGHVVFVEKVVGGFIQDEIKLRPNLQVSVGLRYDWQNYFDDTNNFAPRGSFAWAPGQGRRTVIRGGGGMFYDRTGPGPIFDLIRYDGARLLQSVITNPPYPAEGMAGPTSIVRLDPTVKLPYLVQFGMGVERQLAKTTTLAVNYYGTRGVNLFRSRDVNAPRPPDYAERPDPAYSVWRQIESSASMKVHSAEIALRGRVSKHFTGMVQYTLSRAYNDAGGNPGQGARTTLNSFPANNYDLRGEWARADFDQRHRFNLIGTINPGRYFKVGVAASINSGAPYTVTTGRDDNHDGAANDRPTGVGRNSLQGPGYLGVDLRWSRDIYLNRSKRDKGPMMVAAVDGFNILNHVNYAGYVGVQSSPFFGQPVAALPVRRIQGSFQFRF